MLQDHIYLLQFWIIDNLEQPNDVGVSDLLEDGNFSLCLALGRHCYPSQPALLGKALDDLDRDKVASLQAPGQFDLAMYTSAYLVDDLILIDQLASSDEILLNLGLVSPEGGMLALRIRK